VSKAEEAKPQPRWIRERKLRGWSQAKLAEMIGGDTRSVNRWENGRTFPSPYFCEKLCEVFGKNAEELGLLTEDTSNYEQHADPLDLSATNSSLYNVPEEREMLHFQLDTIANTAAIPHPNQELPGAINSTATSGNENRRRLLAKVRSFWITGVLDQSLHGEVLILLGLHEQREAVENPWRFVLQLPDQSAHPLPPNTHILQVYDEVDGELLILGEPGIGKTTLLLELARHLLDRAEKDDKHPMPVVFNLSSWVVKQQPITAWLVEELNSRYQVPHELAQTWVNANQVLPLLDGLDEVAPTYYSACIETLNAYQHEHGLKSIVVCSRNDDYFAQEARVAVQSAIVVQPLTPGQIEDYLSNAKEQLEAVRVALKEDPTLQELVTTPLMLNILTLAYQGKSVEDLAATEVPGMRRRRVFTTYVKRMLERRGAKARYTLRQTERWLTWLAGKMEQHNQAQFYIERMQPNWLPQNLLCRHYHGIVVGLTYGLLAGISYGVLDGILFGPGIGLIEGLAIGLIGGLVAGMVFEWAIKIDAKISKVGAGVQSSGTGQQKLVNWHVKELIVGLALGLICGSINGLVNGLIRGPAIGLITGLVNWIVVWLIFGLAFKLDTEIQPAEMVAWSWKALRQNWLKMQVSGLIAGLFYGLFYGLFFGIIVGLVVGIAAGLAGGLLNKRLDVSNIVRPNQGIWRSASASIYIGSIGALVVGLFYGLFYGLFNGLSKGLLYGVIYGLLFGILIGLRNGGFACIQHVILRFFLWRAQCISLNYPHFLDYASKRVLLRKVGGGYIFVHRLLLEYFALLDHTINA
jgi:transcriptional regulator with XRE-family HTH domain/DNA polymerase III delta prime subunit